MRMTEESRNLMNNLATLCFDANAVIDNLAYNLDYLMFCNIAEMVHHHVAHVMPVWADEITDKMLILSARPIRGDIGGYDEEYDEWFLKKQWKNIIIWSFNCNAYINWIFSIWICTRFN